MGKHYHWVQCKSGKGFLVKDDKPEERVSHFKENSVGFLVDDAAYNSENFFAVWLIRPQKTYMIASDELNEIDVLQTGDSKRGKFSHKICNICHCLLPIKKFQTNQENKHGRITRPSCVDCRTDIDRRAPKSRQAKQMEKKRPKIGDHFECPICRKHSIAGITAKIVADHNHHTGDIRDFICESCNTGLGRFKNGENYLMNAVAYVNSHDKK